MKPAAQRTFAVPEIQDRLARSLPRWRFEDGHLVRTYRTENWKGTLLVVNTVGHLAEAAWHHPDLAVSYAAVTVKLQSHDAKGITERDFELAGQIEAVIHWQPGRDGGALEGTPDDPRHRYVLYDD